MEVEDEIQKAHPIFEMSLEHGYVKTIINDKSLATIVVEDNDLEAAGEEALGFLDRHHKYHVRNNMEDQST
jgi:hypothetical protein